MNKSHSLHCAYLVGMLVVCAALLPVATGCEDHGLAPAGNLTLPGFSGNITVRGEWPPPDSVRDLRLAAFRNYPPKDILSEVIEGTAFFSDELPYGQDTISYTFQSEALSGIYEYIVIAQNYGTDPFTDWRAVGVYSKTGDAHAPSPLDLGTGTFIHDIDIMIDFVNLPPQPF
ncbi:MAG: hypothetical protein KFH87_02550 [Bacteroidetes bacterium]|nr:hypothetical protein [Bacteroidota bacterium]